MTCPNPRRNIRLRDIVDRAMLPLLEHRAGSGQLRTAARHFARVLDRDPTTADLTVENVHRFIRAMQQSGYGKKTIIGNKKKLLRIWRAAWRLGLAAEPMRLRVHYERTDRRVAAYLSKPPGPGTLRRFYLDAVRPTLRSPRYRSACDVAVRRLDAMLGRYARLDEIEDRLLERFAAWLARRSRPTKDSTAAIYQGHLRTIARRADNGLLPDRHRLPQAQPPAAGTLAHLLESGYHPQRLFGCSPRTADDHRHTLRLLAEMLGREPATADLTDAVAAEFLNWLLNRNAKPSTANNHRARLFALWRFAFDERIVDAPPRIRKLKELRSEPDAWSADEIRRLIDAARTHNPHKKIGGIPSNRWWTASLLVIWYTAIRRGALLKLTTGSVDLDRGILTVPPEAMKNRRGKKYRIGPDAVEALRAIREPRRDRLFPINAASTDNAGNHLAQDFRTLLEAAGVPPSKRGRMSQFHKLRRSVATIIAGKAGIEAAAAMLGHSGTEITKRYIDPSQMPDGDLSRHLPLLTE